MTRTVVFDDDPTGTQSASGVDVVLDANPRTLADALAKAQSVYVLTNTRAMPQARAVALLVRLREAAVEAARGLGDSVQFVLRGDSTLRGHVFAEIDVFTEADSVVLFVPAFPAGGRRTRDGVHYVRLDGVDVQAHLTEFADDPVFPFGASYLPDYVAEKSARAAVSVRGTGADAEERLRRTLVTAAPGTVVIPDVETDDDVVRIARALERARSAGRSVVVRSGSPLAAAIAGVTSPGLLPSPLVPQARPTLLVCGSHTAAAGRQLARVEADHGPAAIIDTERALDDPLAEGERVAELVGSALSSTGFAALASERIRRPEHGLLDHGERVMSAVTAAVSRLRGDAEIVVSKGGITSAEVARLGLGANTARVLGQVLPGVSVWSLRTPEGSERLYVVVPGNVGDDDALVDVLSALRVARA
ncbi:four-carbon acid sugar kinase family protein [Compostimonas suwonensis]|uniref:Uncharacterized protein YgbK (DUF1537 family) n=1 Tax=Compostimonas suwonensis TaxID=1048394 RepID=A0A2M9C0B0_9MICO|nr:four-carbon acid sugar kinase family protein [Compostimonas suwonensis]PJJ63769.1 uncharacterized protein YgbK (DUF1537 family) [Compostimonas suwonensis]